MGQKPPIDLQTFGGRLELLMRERRVTAVQVAESTEVADSSIAGYTRGHRLPNSEALLALATYFGVSCDWLLCRTNVRCPMPPAGEHLANASELALALRGEKPNEQGIACYLVAEDIRVVTDDELRLLDLPPKELRKRARGK